MSDTGIQRSSMRFDETTGDWVLFAPSRLRDPQQLRTRVAADVAQSEGRICPFCPGAEHLTPPEVHREPSMDGRTEWSVRVVPNRFPALQIEESPHRVMDDYGFQHMGGCGAHEVIIESPDHDVQLHAQPVQQVERVLRTARSRYQDLMRDQRFEAIVIFKNLGLNAGTTLAHPHWQVMATAVTPPLLRLKHAVAADYFERTGECLYCELTRREVDAVERVITTNDDFAAIVPYASRLPFEVWILPRHHQSSFAHAKDAALPRLAEIVRTVLQTLHRALDDPDYNLVIDSVARGDEDKPYFLWHLRILPRLVASSGFELGSGMRINTVLPEEAATYLRSNCPSSPGVAD